MLVDDSKRLFATRFVVQQDGAPAHTLNAGLAGGPRTVPTSSQRMSSCQIYQTSLAIMTAWRAGISQTKSEAKDHPSRS